MGRNTQRHLSSKRLAAYLLLWNTAEAQSTSSSRNVTEVTSITTSSGKTITEVYTPTSVSISGLAPPITVETTITTTNSAGQTVAIAVAAGAGVVAAGALAAWIFKPVLGAPPAPTSPPPYSTKSQDRQSKTTSPTRTTTTTSSHSFACPYPKTGYPLSFQQVQGQSQWTAGIPSPSIISSYSPKCTQQGSNNQLLRGTGAGYIDALAGVFCNGDLTKSRTATLGQADLPSGSTYKNAELDGVRVAFDFDHTLTNAGCSQNCINAYSEITTSCEYNSHVLYGGGSLKQGCGTYHMKVDADPRTNLSCNPVPNPVYQDYEYRNGAIDSINKFCTAQGGKVLKQNDQSTDIKWNAFTATYVDDCVGNGTYTISTDTCVSYLIKALDSCDTDTTMYKHGGTVTDIDNCGAFTFHPIGYDVFSCYPQNENAGYISGTHVQVSPAMAKDAIGQFCDRQGNGQKYTLDPNNVPTSFADNTCTQSGMASCGYYYNNDGSRASSGSTGDIFIRMNAQYDNPTNTYQCSARQEYAIHGDRCHQELNKVIGVQPKGQCVGSDPSKLDLGTFLENGDKGCVLWNMWAVKTT